MAIRVVHQPEFDLTIFLVEEASVDERIAALRWFYDEGTTRNALWDMTALEGSRPTADEIRTIVGILSDHAHKRPDGRTALVGKSDLDFGLSRMGSILSELRELPWEIQAFRTQEEALAWITDAQAP